MNEGYWKRKWEIGDTRFHRDDVHPKLIGYYEHLPAGPVLVPLCGKTHDLTWLAAQGREVVGVELSQIACRDYFREKGETPSLRPEGQFTVYSSSNVTLWCGDFFLFDAKGIAAVYDRAALVALPKEMRERYAARLDAPAILLVTFEFPPDTVQGPPFPVFEDEVRRLFADRYRIECLGRGADPFLSNHPKFAGKTAPQEAVYSLSSG